MYNKPQRRSPKSAANGSSPRSAGSNADVPQLQFLQQQAKIKRRRVLFLRCKSGISALMVLLEILLALRFGLRLAGANPDNAVAKLIYGLSKPFVAPFLTLFVSSEASTYATLGQKMFDGHLLVAMVIYGLLGFLAISLATYIYDQVCASDV